jgi:hypothetical protein
VAEGRGGVVKKFQDHTTPSARTDEASRLFLNRAATPPPAEEGCSLRQTSNARLQLKKYRMTGIN